jgi:hypothetical protein
VLAALSAVALGFGAHALFDTPVGLVLAAGPILVVVGLLVTRGPRLCLAALVITDLLGFYQETVDAGGIALRVIDVFWLATVGWMVVARRREGPAPRAGVGQPHLALCLAALGVSLYPVVVLGWGEAGDPLLAWVRVVQTFSLVWLVPYALRSDDDLEYMTGAIELGLSLELIRAIIDAAISGGLSDRLEGGNGPNTTGLLAALLVIAAVHAPVPRHRGLRACMLVLGLAGLLLSRSLGGTAAVAATLGIFGLRSVSTRRRRTHAGSLAPFRILLLVIAVLAVAAMFRPENLPISSEFEESTTVRRTVIAEAGLELFADKPITGVGWGRAPDELARTSTGAAAAASANTDFAPGKSPTSVHNVYVEILSESGLVGLLCLLALFVGAARGIRSVLHATRRDSRTDAIAIGTLAMLVAVLFWWNGNALFGVQPDTVLAATFLGMLAVVGVARSSTTSPAEPVTGASAGWRTARPPGPLPHPPSA